MQVPQREERQASFRESVLPHPGAAFVDLDFHFAFFVSSVDQASPSKSSGTLSENERSLFHRPALCVLRSGQEDHVVATFA